MRLGASEVVKGGAITFFCYEAKIDLQAAFKESAGTSRACRLDLGNLIIGPEVLHYVAAGYSGYDNVEVALSSRSGVRGKTRNCCV